MKILIIKLSSFGDIIHALPVLTNLKKAFPQSQISWLISEKFKDLIEKHNCIDKIYTVLPKNEKFDYILDLQGLIKTGFISYILNKKINIGLVPARERLAEIFYKQKIYTSAILDPNVHIIKRNLKILKAFNLEEKDFELSSPKAFWGEELEVLKKEYIICSPESRWESKTWVYWQEFLVKLNEYINKNNKLEILIVGNSNFTENLKLENLTKVKNLSGKTSLKDLKNIIRKASLVIGSDSGIIHLATSFGIKTLALHGATSPFRTGPWQGEYLFLNLNCSPCHKRKCPLKLENKLKCLKEISVDNLFSKTLELLN